jgi:hypothetical protein
MQGQVHSSSISTIALGRKRLRRNSETCHKAREKQRSRRAVWIRGQSARVAGLEAAYSFTTVLLMLCQSARIRCAHKKSKEINVDALIALLGEGKDLSSIF